MGYKNIYGDQFADKLGYRTMLLQNEVKKELHFKANGTFSVRLKFWKWGLSEDSFAIRVSCSTEWTGKVLE